MNARKELQAAAIALLASVAIGSLLMLVAGKSPATVWWAMLERTTTDSYNLGQVLYKATALALAGLSVSIALDVGLFNIGAEAQLLAGVLACAVVGAALPAGTPGIVAIPACLGAAAARRTRRCSSPPRRSRSCGGCARARRGGRRGSRSAAIRKRRARSESRCRASSSR
jgi:hypothetical protein